MTRSAPRFLLSAALTTLLTLLPGSASAFAQGRISQAVSASSPRVALSNTVSPRVRAAIDLGAAPADKILSSVTLRFNMTQAQSAALDALLVAQQTPSSPQYHQWLTPEQYAAQFGLSSTDLAKVTAWLQSQGLTVTSVARGHGFVTASGTVAQLQAAFNTSIHTVSMNGEQHIANVTEPSLPASIGAVTETITGLSDVRLKPHIRPRFTSSLSGNHYLAPGDIYTIYDINPLLSNSITGSGITIAVAGQVDIYAADVAAFRSAAGLSVNPFTTKVVGTDPGYPSTSGPSSDDLSESSLDVEWSGAVAPSASILFVTGQDVLANSLTQIIDQNLAPIATVSYGDCESNFGSSNIATFNALFRQGAAQGQTIVGPAGDSGATDCDYGGTTPPTDVATQGLAVDFPASSPYLTGVGGTQFNPGTGTYFNTTNGNYQGSAISYIPETVWNETALFGELSGGGGGASAYFTKPAWQVGTGVPSDFSRDVPDIAFDAAAGPTDVPYLYCVSGSCTNGFRDAAGNLNVVGGTSVATPEFAAMVALLEQKIQSRVGLANPTIYALANSTYNTSVFHDVTTGTNAQPCTAGTPNCPNGGSIGYNAGVGYDQATGWGSLDVFNFVNDWSLVPPLSSGTNGTSIASTTLTTTTPSVTAGASVTFTATVASASTGTSATPTGTVQLLVDGAATGSSATLSSGTATLVYLTTPLASGTHVFTSVYSGDGVYAGSKGTFSLDVVSASAADFKLSPIPASITTRSGTDSSGLTFTLQAVNGFAGPVAFSASTTSTTLAASYSFSAQTVTLAANGTGTTVFTLSAYQSDAESGIGRLKLGTATASNQMPLGSRSWAVPAAGLTFAGLLLLTLPRRRSRWTALALAVASIGVLGASGCSSSTSSTLTSSGSTVNTTPGTYTVVVTAAGTNAAGTAISHSSTVTFTVQ